MVTCWPRPLCWEKKQQGVFAAYSQDTPPLFVYSNTFRRSPFKVQNYAKLLGKKGGFQGISMQFKFSCSWPLFVFGPQSLFGFAPHSWTWIGSVNMTRWINRTSAKDPGSWLQCLPELTKCQLHSDFLSLLHAATLTYLLHCRTSFVHKSVGLGLTSSSKVAKN